MASDEAQLRAIDEEFKKATTDDQRNDCAQRAAAVSQEGGVFSARWGNLAHKNIKRELVGTMTVATPLSRRRRQGPPPVTTVVLDGGRSALRLYVENGEAYPRTRRWRAAPACFGMARDRRRAV